MEQAITEKIGWGGVISKKLFGGAFSKFVLEGALNALPNKPIINVSIEDETSLNTELREIVTLGSLPL